MMTFQPTERRDLVPTFRQFDEAKRRDLVARYGKDGVTRAEVDELYGPDYWRTEWFHYALAAYNQGAVFSPQHWHRLEPWQQTKVLRTSRALRMPGNVMKPWSIPGDNVS